MKETKAEIRNKLQVALTVLEALSDDKNVPEDIIKKGVEKIVWIDKRVEKRYLLRRLFCGFLLVMFLSSAPSSFSYVTLTPEEVSYPSDRELLDLAFENDTPAHIMIQTRVDKENRQAYFNFYGTDDGRKVEMTTTGAYNYKTITEAEYEDTTDLPPGETQLKDHGGQKTGFDVRWYRTITYGDGQEKEDTFFSRYRAFPAFYLRGIEPEVIASEESLMNSTEGF